LDRRTVAALLFPGSIAKTLQDMHRGVESIRMQWPVSACATIRFGDKALQPPFV
jgi:hypothetical protein